jgi:hypothetical protein
LLSTTEMPVTRAMASAASASGVRAIASALMPSDTVGAAC